MVDYRCSPYNAPVDGVWLAIGVLLFNRPLNYSLPINEYWSTANPLELVLDYSKIGG